MSKNNTGFIVEGHAEQLAFQKYTHRKFIKRASRFGGDVKVETIVDEIASLARLLSSRCNNIIAIMDREAREETSSEFEKSITDSLKNYAIKNVKITIVCADRMFENWILADIDSCKCKKYINSRVKQKNYEGTHGKNELKKIFMPKSHYQETTHGVELFNLIKQDVAISNSLSFKHFIDNL